MPRAAPSKGTPSAASVEKVQRKVMRNVSYRLCDLHRRALDAHPRLAELEEDQGHEVAAIEVLRHAIQLDHYAEEIYRRLMVLQSRIGESDSISSTWRQLQRSLADLDLDPAQETTRLYRELIRNREALASTPTQATSVRLESASSSEY
jgi:DNA-binding SARP family transcriptional activator